MPASTLAPSRRQGSEGSAMTCPPFVPYVVLLTLTASAHDTVPRTRSLHLSVLAHLSIVLHLFAPASLRGWRSAAGLSCGRATDGLARWQPVSWLKRPQTGSPSSQPSICLSHPPRRETPDKRAPSERASPSSPGSAAHCLLDHSRHLGEGSRAACRDIIFVALRPHYHLNHTLTV